MWVISLREIAADRRWSLAMVINADGSGFSFDFFFFGSRREALASGRAVHLFEHLANGSAAISATDGMAVNVLHPEGERRYQRTCI